MHTPTCDPRWAACCTAFLLACSSGCQSGSSGDVDSGGNVDSGANGDATGVPDSGTALLPGQPTLLFSDLESAPKAGWSASAPGAGSVVTVWGSGLGTSRDDSFISVGGQDLDQDSDYMAWGEAWPTPFWSRITFQLNDQMVDGDTAITVTVDGKASNALEFSIRAGRILFVAAAGADGTGSLEQPFVYTQASGSEGIVANMEPGDVYYFRAGIYDTPVNGGNSVLWIRDAEPSGLEGRPISFIAYPGELPILSVASYQVNFNKGIQLSNRHTVFSGFQIDSEWQAASLSGSYHRFVGNDLIGLKGKYGSGTGIITTGGSGTKILGNAIHGGRSQDRFDHATYFSGCADVVGNHLGWNYVYDNDFGRGPELSINHQQDRCTPDVQILKAHFVFNNIVDCSPQRAVAINVYDLSYDEGEPEPEPTYVYNNLFLNCGTLDTVNTEHIGWAPTVVANTAHTRFYNNVLYNSHYVGFQVSGNVLSAELRNNIVVMNSSSVLDGRADLYLAGDGVGSSHIANNLFFDVGDSEVNSAGVDAEANLLDQDPLFTAPQELDFSLQAGSPAINAGADDLLFEVPAPAYAPIERDMLNTLRQGGFDLGALEYQP